MVHPVVTELSTNQAHPPWVSHLRSTVKISRWQPTSGQAYWWGLGLVSLALGLVNGALVISAGVGVVAYRQLGQLSPRQWQALRQQVERALPLPGSTAQRALVLSLLLTASTYTLTSLWQSTHSLVLAMGLTGQTALTFFVVATLLRSPRPSTDPARPPGRQASLDQRRSKDLAPRDAMPSQAGHGPDQTLMLFEQALAELTQADPLKRLIAVRHLARLVGQAPSGQSYGVGAEVTLQSHLTDCFQVMLAHEPEPIVRSAVRAALALLRQAPLLPAGSSPLAQVKSLASDASLLPPPPRSGRRPATQYVEYLEV